MNPAMHGRSGDHSRANVCAPIGQNPELSPVQGDQNRHPEVIVCPRDYSRRRLCMAGLLHIEVCHLYSLSASQLMRKNPTEAIVDKDNHLRDALKYILLSLPSPSERPREMKRDELIQQACR